MIENIADDELLNQLSRVGGFFLNQVIFANGIVPCKKVKGKHFYYNSRQQNINFVMQK